MFDEMSAYDVSSRKAGSALAAGPQVSNLFQVEDGAFVQRPKGLEGEPTREPYQHQSEGWQENV